MSVLSLEVDYKDNKNLHNAWTVDTDGNIFIWKGEMRINRITLSSPIHSLCTTQNDEGFFVWISNKTGGNVRIYNSSELQEIQTLQFDDSALLTLSVVGNLVWISNDKGTLSSYSSENFQLIDELLDFGGVGNQCVIQVSDYLWIGDSSGTIFIINPQTKELLKRVSVDNAPITSFLALQNESQVWSIGPEDKIIKRWFFVFK